MMELMARNPKSLLWGFLAALLSCSACTHERDPDDLLKSRLAILRGRTSPPGSRIVNSSGLIRSPFSVSASWECETDWDWKKYSEWVELQFAGFQVIRRDNSEVVFSRPVGGDTESIAVRALAHSQPLRVRVSFSMYPQ